jgi:hypothetical protein
MGNADRGGTHFQAHRDLRYPDLEVQVHQVALTREQVREFGLPSTPLKEKERRAAAWRAKWGHDQTEIDALAALRPDLLEQIAPRRAPAVLRPHARGAYRSCGQASNGRHSLV